LQEKSEFWRIVSEKGGDDPCSPEVKIKRQQ
jgi:hypothetical protein